MLSLGLDLRRFVFAGYFVLQEWISSGDLVLCQSVTPQKRENKAQFWTLASPIFFYFFENIRNACYHFFREISVFYLRLHWTAACCGLAGKLAKTVNRDKLQNRKMPPCWFITTNSLFHITCSHLIYWPCKIQYVHWCSLVDDRIIFICEVTTTFTRRCFYSFIFYFILVCVLLHICSIISSGFPPFPKGLK